ncbi:MAG: cation:proton antiporter [Victivallaceae bacterium]|nr:cation:proton antiporter [Victivallaceae bacterium]
MNLSGILNTSGTGVLVMLGLVVFGGMAGAWFFQKIRFPQVVGYIFIGLLLGDTGLGWVHPSDVEHMRTLNLFALGIIGFLVGGELKFSMFKQYAREFIIILLGEGIAAFLVVGACTFGIVYWLTASVAVSAAAGVVFGAIASATDPASTIDVIWEYRAKGVMTAAIIAIVALDDALALTLYGIGTSSAQLLTANGGSVMDALKSVSIELFGALALGAVFAFTLVGFLRYQQQSDRAVALAVGVILLVIGMASFYHLDVILAAMMVGFLLCNLAPRRSEEIFKLLRSFSIPIYVLFFVLVGARISVWTVPHWLWLVAICYVVGRSVGKWGGCWFGARLAGSAESVRKYMGYGIFAQGGVAIGLSIVAAENLKNVQIAAGLSLGDMIVYVVTATTLVLQFMGPPMVKLSLKLSGEAGRDVTKMDVMKSMTVGQAMTTASVMLPEDLPLSAAFKTFRERDSRAYMVVASDRRVVGILSFDSLRNVAADYASWNFLLVADAMTKLSGSVTPDQNLWDVCSDMKMERVEFQVVVDSPETMRGVGMLELHDAELKVENELLVRTAQLEKRVAV